MTRVACLATIVLAVWALPARAAELSVAGRFPVVPPPGVVSMPSDVAVDDDGFVYVLTGAYVQRYDRAGTLGRTWGGMGSGPGQFLPPGGPYVPIGPSSIDVDLTGRVYVADTGGNRIVVFTRDGEFVAKWGHDGSAGDFVGPGEVVVERSGNVLVLDNPFGYRRTLHRLSPTGQSLAHVDGTSLMSLAAGDDGTVYARESGEVVDRFDAAALTRLAPFDLLPPHPAPQRTYTPSSCCGIAASAGSIWVGKLPVGQLQRYTPAGAFVSACQVIAGGVPAFTGSNDQLAAGHDGFLYILRRSRRSSEVLRLRIDDPAAPACAARVEPSPLQPRVRALRLTIDRETVSVIRARQLRRLTVVYSTSTPSRVLLRLTRLAVGRRVRGRCFGAGEGAMSRSRCTRRSTRATVTLKVAQALMEHSYRLAAGLRPRSLRPGRYELAATAIDAAGARSAPARVSLGVRR